MVGAIELPDHAPIPQRRADALRQEAPAVEKPASPATPAAESACRKELRTLGIAFTAISAMKAKGGCRLPYPLKVTALSAKIRLQPAAVLNCRTARAAAILFQNKGAAAAKKHFEARIATVVHGSAYVCRPINGMAKLSEHAYGNALDISAVELSDGRRVEVSGKAKGAEGKFLADIRTAACGPFTTVLGPGTNADHSNHFHFDLKKRRKPYCR
ncbi:extensin family protein [Chelativorans salis]|uniref:Extensin family protein n=1 Tax=Chelativorans salis TaxID=2978478 RepID=A0ABT2LKS1_9HYPH|nr:extensin family protein [Chelativorans sp. EGI FJ00035]MCT7374866.1 extensin family protein [Chelativorans sp. EGI FJ00035]